MNVLRRRIVSLQWLGATSMLMSVALGVMNPLIATAAGPAPQPKPAIVRTSYGPSNSMDTIEELLPNFRPGSSQEIAQLVPLATASIDECLTSDLALNGFTVDWSASRVVGLSDSSSPGAVGVYFPVAGPNSQRLSAAFAWYNAVTHEFIMNGYMLMMSVANQTHVVYLVNGVTILNRLVESGAAMQALDGAASANGLLDQKSCCYQFCLDNNGIDEDMIAALGLACAACAGITSLIPPAWSVAFACALCAGAAAFFWIEAWLFCVWWSRYECNIPQCALPSADPRPLALSSRWWLGTSLSPA